MKENKNPLLCDSVIGVCNPKHTVLMSERITTRVAPIVKVIYFTDPICSSCWGIEAQLRKLKFEYGKYLDIEYRMGGLLSSWDVYDSGGISQPSDVAAHWDEVSEIYNMPIDGDLWLENPLCSSYPPSIAFKAAQIQDKEKAMNFLRRIKEMVFVEKKNTTEWKHLKQAAVECGLDGQRMKIDINSVAKLLFQQDLELSHYYEVKGFPTLFFQHQGKQKKIYGFHPYYHFEEMIRSCIPDVQKQHFEGDSEELFQLYPSMTTREFSELANLSMIDAEVALSYLHTTGRIKKLAIKNGILWQCCSR